MSQEDNRQDDSVTIDSIPDSPQMEENPAEEAVDSSQVEENAVEEGADATPQQSEEAAASKNDSSSEAGSPKEPTIVPVEQTLSNKLYLIPVSGRPIFPGIFTPLMITASDDARVAEDAYSGDGLIGIVMLKEDSENPTASDLHQVGTVARIIKKINLPDGGVNIFISTINVNPTRLFF